MKKMQIISFLLLLVTLGGFLVNQFFQPFPDWLVRVDGIIMLMAIFMFSFSTARLLSRKG